MYVTQPVLPVLSQEFGVTPARAGTTVSAVVLAIAVASSFYGPLSDALGRKRVMVASMLLLVVPTLACALAPGFSALLAFRATQGLLIPGMTAVSVAYAGDEFHPRELSAVVGGIIGASVTGGLAGRVVSGLVTAAAGWRAAFVVSAAVTLAAAIGMALELPPAQRREVIAWGRAYREMMLHLVDRRLVGAFLIGSALFFGFIGVFTYLPYRLTAAPFGLSTALVSSVYLVYVAGVIASPIAGRLAGRVPPRLLMGVGLAIGLAGLAGTLSRSIAAVVASLVVLCAGVFTAQAIAPAFVNASARQAKGGANALYLSFYYIGGSLGSVLPGLAWQRFAWPGVVAMCGAALLAGILADWALCAPG